MHLESVDLKLERYGLGLRLRHADFKKVLAHATLRVSDLPALRQIQPGPPSTEC